MDRRGLTGRFRPFVLFPISRFLVLPGASRDSLLAAIAALGPSGLIGLLNGSQTAKLARFGVTSFSFRILGGAAFTRRYAIG